MSFKNKQRNEPIFVAAVFLHFDVVVQVAVGGAVVVASLHDVLTAIGVGGEITTTPLSVTLTELTCFSEGGVAHKVTWGMID